MQISSEKFKVNISYVNDNENKIACIYFEKFIIILRLLW